MKFYLPICLLQSLLTCLSVGCLTLSSGNAKAEEQASLILGEQDTLTIDYADADTLLHADGVLQLMGGTQLNLSNCGEGDGKTYTLLTGVYVLRDAEGNAVVLDSTNNSISHYFDTTQPGTGFWSDASLQLTDSGTLQFVRHEENVKASQTVATHQSGSLDECYYSNIVYQNIWGYSNGGAISGINSSSIHLYSSGSIEFKNISATSNGGAIYGEDNVYVSQNGTLCFNKNSADTNGGAICGSGASITLNENSNIIFNSNLSKFGGAISSINSSSVYLCHNGSINFCSNTASRGGAIYGMYGDTITIQNNGRVEYCDNTANSKGGAIDLAKYCRIQLNGNANIVFSNNNAMSGTGGGISGDHSTVVLNSNKNVEFLKNIANTYGGAIYGYCNTIELNNNSNIIFSCNESSSAGGGIYGTSCTIEINNNNKISFSENRSSRGSAVYAQYGTLNIQNNDFVLFEKNIEKGGNTYRLRSIYTEGSGGSFSLSAAEGNSIVFRDSVYIASGSTVKLNADYKNDNGYVIKQQGDILFTGKYTVTHLNEILASDNVGRVAMESEILNSRTSELNSSATLYGGALRVEETAVLKLNGGLTVAEGGNASVEVKAAELNVGSHALSMVSGSSLALADGAKVTATELTITTGATLAVMGSVSTEPLTEQVAALTLSKETVAGFDASRAVNMGSVSVLEGDLTLESGSLLSLDDAYLELSGNLFFDVAEGEEKIALDIAPGVITDENNQVVLFNVDGVVTFGFDGLTASADNGMVYCVKAEDYFTGSRVQESTKLVYDSKSGVVYLEDVTEGTVPEPTSSTLSLLALAALAARRRRK